MTDLKIHPTADLFPLLDAEGFEGLVEDIRANGLREPIKLWKDQVIDGRNRLNACEVVGIPAEFEDVTSQVKDPTAYIVGLNLNRRHLNPGQRAALAMELFDKMPKRGRPKCGGEEKVSSGKISQGKVAQLFGVSTASISKARHVKKWNEEQLAQVIAGELTLTTAYSNSQHREFMSKPRPKRSPAAPPKMEPKAEPQTAKQEQSANHKRFIELLDQLPELKRAKGRDLLKKWEAAVRREFRESTRELEAELVRERDDIAMTRVDLQKKIKLQQRFDVLNPKEIKQLEIAVHPDTGGNRTDEQRASAFQLIQKIKDAMAPVKRRKRR